MTLTIELSSEEEARLREEASRRGQDLSSYARSVLTRSLAVPQSLAKILAPFREQVERSGITDDELDALVEEAREASYRKRQSGKP